MSGLNFGELVMPKDIIEAYAMAVKARESCTRKAFAEVVEFCENDLQCSADNSRKRNILMLWSYDKLAQSYARAKDYEQAYNYWRKALALTTSAAIRLNLGLKMLDAADKSIADITRKATKIVEITTMLQKVYQENGDVDNVQKMQSLTISAMRLLPQSNAVN